MQVKLKRVDDAFHFKATGQTDIPVDIDAGPGIGGHEQGARPMELVLMGLASCAVFDIILILKKQRQVVRDVDITVNGERRSEPLPAVFTHIHIHFTLAGEIDQKKAKRAVSLSVEKYCSVAEMLGKSVEIDYTFDIKA